MNNSDDSLQRKYYIFEFFFCTKSVQTVIGRLKTKGCIYVRTFKNDFFLNNSSSYAECTVFKIQYATE